MFRPAAVDTFADSTNTLEKDHEVTCENWLPSKTACNGSNRELTVRESMNFLNKQANPNCAHELETEGGETRVFVLFCDHHKPQQKIVLRRNK